MRSHTDSREIIKRVLSGDAEAFRELVESCQRLVAHIVYRMIPNETEREDICQEVFLKAYRNLGGFKHNCKFSTWIGQIAYNTSLNYLDKKKLVLFDDITPEEMTFDSQPADSPWPSELSEANELSECLKREIAGLPGHYATIVALYHLEEMTYDEIGKIMKLPDGTVKSYLFRARKMLKDRLLEKYTKEELCQ